MIQRYSRVATMSKVKRVLAVVIGVLVIVVLGYFVFTAVKL